MPRFALFFSPSLRTFRMKIMTDGGDSGAANLPDGGRMVYESPVLAPVGNLRDLLAGSGSQLCDAGPGDPGPFVIGTPSCPSGG